MKEAPTAPFSSERGSRAPYDTRHLAAIDGLRGIAILLVMIYHFWLITWFSTEFQLFGRTFNIDMYARAGMTGVTVFFFVSGFALFYPYAQHKFDGRELHTVAMFYYRRMLKILPSYYLGLAAWIGLGFATFPSYEEGVHQVLAHVFFLHTFWDETYSGINGVLWSLGIEVQFYVFFPLVAWAALRRPLYVFPAMILIAIVYRLAVMHHYNAQHEIHQLPATLDIFGCGMLCAWLYRAVAVRMPKLASNKLLWTGVALAGALLCYAALLNIYERRSEATWLAAWDVYGVPTIAGALLVLATGSLFAFRSWQRVLANPILLGLSYLSYNLYLWHQLLANWIVSQHLTAFQASSPTPDSPPLRALYTWIFVGLAIGVAWLVTTFVEQPLLRRRPFEAVFARRPARTRPVAESAKLAVR